MGLRPRSVRRSRRLDPDVQRLRWRPVQDQLADEEREVAGGEDRVRRLQLCERPLRSPDQLLQRPKPVQALFPGHRGVRRGRRRKDEEHSVPEPTLLEPVLRALAKDALIRGFADERDDLRAEFVCNDLEPRLRAREVPRAKVTGAASRPAGGIRQPGAE